MNFEFWINGKLSKIGHHFSNKVIYANYNKCPPKLVFFNEKENEKDSMIFKVESQIIALFDSLPLIQNSKFNNFLWVC